MAGDECDVLRASGHGRCRMPPVERIGDLSLCDLHRSRLFEAIAARTEALRREHDRAMREREKVAPVYYVRRADGLIKIGWTGQLARRLTTLTREHGPIELLATHPGGRDVEQRQHARFRDARVEGEWFRPTPELLAHIDKIARRRAKAEAA